MRLSEDRIKERIIHPDPEMRIRAVRYFAESFSSDPQVAPLMIQALETFDKKFASRLVGDLTQVAHSAEHVEWLVKELSEEENEQFENYPFNLGRALAGADVELLKPLESTLNEMPLLDEIFREAIEARLEMRSWDIDTCWQQLEEFCEQGKDKEYVSEVHWPHALRIVDALARYGEECEAKARDILAVDLDDVTGMAIKWMEPLAVRLAAEARLESLLPSVMRKLRLDGDLTNEASARFFVRIGTPEVVQTIGETFAQEEYHVQLYAGNALEHIHLDQTVQTCMDLIPLVEAQDIRSILAQSILAQFEEDGIEVARQVLLNQKKPDLMTRELRLFLLNTCTFMGVHFPEYEQWIEEEKRDMEEHQKRVRELKDDPERLTAYLMERLHGVQEPMEPPQKPPVMRAPAPPKWPTQQKKKVGRNNPCPCGSGKKYKKCCGNR